MAGELVGRSTCPECGAEAKVTRTEKCLYRYCRECGSGYHARTEKQKAALLAKVASAAPIAPTSIAPKPAETTPVQKAPATPFGGLFR